MFGIAFDEQNNFGIITENGAAHYDEINKIKKGGNYGWPNLQIANQPPEISNSSIKPLRSYWIPNAPAQMIYYDDNNYPELNNTFIFASSNSATLYSLKFDNKGEYITRELKIKPDHGGPYIAIAKSPEGDIYYGTDSIYKLESIDTTNMKKIIFPVEVIGSVEINDVLIDQNKKSVTIALSNNELNVQQTIKISKVIIDGIYEIVEQDETIEFEIDSSNPEYNTIHLSLPHEGEMELVIKGTTIIPEFPISIILIFLVSITMIIFLPKIYENLKI